MGCVSDGFGVSSILGGLSCVSSIKEVSLEVVVFLLSMDSIVSVSLGGLHWLLPSLCSAKVSRSEQIGHLG